MSRSGVLCIVAWLAVLSGGPALAFHDGGVARCDGCHVMHDGNVASGPAGEDVLLLSESPSDGCLRCHASNSGGVLGSDPLVPPAEKGGGNLVFLMEDNLNDAPDGATNPIIGDAAGHNVVAPGRGLYADPRYELAPGGTFPAQELSCTSCHDPHGNAGFRLLYGAGEVQGGLAHFSAPAPDAVGIGLGERESDANHTAYRTGMSQWCANCHGLYHDGDLATFQHPVDRPLGPEIAARYNDYAGDDLQRGGISGSSYRASVPFETGSAATGPRSTRGPSSTSKVMCLTCHRAHASSAPAAGRWDFNVALLSDDGVVSRSYAIPDRYTSPAQGTLCAKCHVAGTTVPGRDPDRGRGRPLEPRDRRRTVPR